MPHSMEKIFAKNLKAARKAAGLTQRELAEKLGYSEKSISKWESGNAIAPSAMLPEIARALCTDIDSLFAQSGEAEFFLGIDGGGTKTEFLLTDKNGREIRRSVLSTSNPVDIGIDDCIGLLRRGIYSVCSTTPLRKTALYAGIAGGSVGDNADKIQKALKPLGFLRTDVGNDMATAYAAGLGGSDGISVIMGTGSVVYAKHKGNTFRFGGYGYLFNDPGSGFNIGRDGIIASLQAEERGGTLLLKKVQAKYHSTVLSALPIFYREGKREIASVAPLVFEAEAEGDNTAREILESNMQKLADIINTAAEKFDGETKAVLSGSIAKRFEALKKYLLPHIDKKVHVELAARTPVEGALILAGVAFPE